MPRTLATVLLALLLLIVLPSRGALVGPGTGDPEDAAGPGTAPDPEVERLGLVLLWHQHQPRYPVEDGVVTRPWVRVHATKDYLDMVELAAAFPEVPVTFNLTPALLLQLEELMSGTVDRYWALTERPADELTPDERVVLLERFFDVNPKVAGRFPRYVELAAERDAAGGAAAAAETFSTGDLRDLQVLFNLAWTDPSYLAEDPLAALVRRGRGFGEADKAVVLARHRELVDRVIEAHARAWDEGRIEVTTTPLAHPILPLLVDTQAAVEGDPAALLPRDRFREYVDAREQVTRGLDTAERLLGARPVGMWPAEGAVSTDVVPLFAEAGVRWIATGEDVLARSAGIGTFARGPDDLVERGDLLYRPWRVETRHGPVDVFFRDNVLSDLIGFRYSGMPAKEAVDDLISRLAAIRDQPGGGPRVVTIALDGENAWEHYPNDGIDFLRLLYARIAATDWLEPTTPSAWLDRHDDTVGSLDGLFPGSWFQPSFATWIGEDEEASAWNLLRRVRLDLRAAEADAEPARYAAAYEAMLFAEGSDWFWWYGADQDSGDDRYFDGAFRELLGQVYDRLGLPRPVVVSVPLVADPPVPPTHAATEAVTITVDGEASAGEWDGATRYDLGEAFEAVELALDEKHLQLRLVGNLAATPVDVYLGAPRGGPTRGTTMAGDLLGFGATQLVRWRPGAGVCVHGWLPSVERVELSGSCDPVTSATGPGGVELAVPLEAFGGLEAGDRVAVRIVASDELLPREGPGELVAPDIGSFDAVVDVEDPEGDDHGPGTYTYPTDPVFVPGAYDLRRFRAGIGGDDLVLSFEVGAAVSNPWNSPNGLSVQTFDVYVDLDPGAGTGAQVLLPGRNAALADGGWDQAITVEGWDPAVYVADVSGATTETKPTLRVAVVAEAGRVTVRVPLAVLRESGAMAAADQPVDPASWGYAVVLLSQEGFPSPGVRRVRDVEARAAQWRLGGGPPDANHTRIIDALWPEPGVQEELLGEYPPRSSVEDLRPADLPKVPLLTFVR